MDRLRGIAADGHRYVPVLFTRQQLMKIGAQTLMHRSPNHSNNIERGCEEAITAPQEIR